MLFVLTHKPEPSHRLNYTQKSACQKNFFRQALFYIVCYESIVS